MPRLFAILRLSVFLFAIYVFLSFRLSVFLSAFLISFWVTYADSTRTLTSGDIVNTDQLDIFQRSINAIVSPPKTAKNNVLIDVEGQYPIHKRPFQMRHENIVEAVGPFTSELWADVLVTSNTSVSTTKKACLSYLFNPPLIVPTFSNASPGTANLCRGSIVTSTFNSVQFSDWDLPDVDICILVGTEGGERGTPLTTSDIKQSHVSTSCDHRVVSS